MRPLLVFASDWIATVFRVGYLPLAPGTWASLIAMVVWRFIPEMGVVSHVLILSNLFLVGVIASEIVSARNGNDDPSYVVIDEWVGMWIGLAVVPKDWSWMVVAFLLFRLFDVTKIFPARHLEKVKGGWGIMLDDVVAGIYALLVTELIRTLL